MASPSTRLPVPDAPGLVAADLAGQIETLRGRAVVLANTTGAHWGWRAWGEVSERAGFPYLDVVRERDWWRHVLLGAEIDASLIRAWPAGAVWVLTGI